MLSLDCFVCGYLSFTVFCCFIFVVAPWSSVIYVELTLFSCRSFLSLCFYFYFLYYFSLFVDSFPNISDIFKNNNFFFHSLINLIFILFLLNLILNIHSV